MSLFYPLGENAFRSKTSEREDMVNVRFVELALYSWTTAPVSNQSKSRLAPPVSQGKSAFHPRMAAH
jgi:hypothetical protein